jgi:hypothetical protein
MMGRMTGMEGQIARVKLNSIHDSLILRNWKHSIVITERLQIGVSNPIG